MLIKIIECFTRASICNRYKSLITQLKASRILLKQFNFQVLYSNGRLATKFQTAVKKGTNTLAYFIQTLRNKEKKCL
jgi:hypothetical protein